jgi:hypothetical protein
MGKVSFLTLRGSIPERLIGDQLEPKSLRALVTHGWGIPLIDRLVILEDYSRVLLKRFN